MKKYFVWLGIIGCSFSALPVAGAQQVSSSVSAQLQGVSVDAQANPSVQPRTKLGSAGGSSGGVGRYALRMQVSSLQQKLDEGEALTSAPKAASALNLPPVSSSQTMTQNSPSSWTKTSWGIQKVGAGSSAGSGGSLGDGRFPDSTRGSASLGSGWLSEDSAFSPSSGLSFFNPTFSGQQLSPNYRISSGVSTHSSAVSQDSALASMMMNPYEYIYSLYGISMPGSQGLAQVSDLQTHVVDWSDMDLQLTLHPALESEMELNEAGTVPTGQDDGY